MLPFTLKALNFDPATALARFAATIVDVPGIVIYFSIALFLMTGSLLSRVLGTSLHTRVFCGLEWEAEGGTKLRVGSLLSKCAKKSPTMRTLFDGTHEIEYFTKAGVKKNVCIDRESGNLRQ